MTKAKSKETKLLLSIDDIQQNGMKLTDAMERIETLKDYSNSLMFAYHSDTDRAMLLVYMAKFCDHIFEQMTILHREINDIAFPLLECDNPVELEAYKKGKG